MREFRGKSIIALPLDYVVIDTETTGLDYECCDLIEIAALKIKNGVPVEKFSSLVKPPLQYDFLKGSENAYYVDAFITDLTGITDEMLKDAPTPEQVIPAFLDFVGDSILMGHNAHFDINFLYDASERCERHLGNNYIDTLRIARKVFPDLKHHRLSDIVSALAIPQPTAHRAAADCETTYRCYEAMRTWILKDSTEQDFINRFKKAGHSVKAAEITSHTQEFDNEHPLYGKTVVFTGGLSNMTRREAMQRVADLGGINADRITKETNYLVIGSSDFASSVKNGKTNKMKKAEDLILKGYELSIISEAAFFDYIAGAKNTVNTVIAKTPTAISPMVPVVGEKIIFQQAKDCLKVFLKENHLPESAFRLSETLSHSTVYLSSGTICRLCYRKNKHYFSVPAVYALIVEKYYGTNYTVKTDYIICDAEGLDLSDEGYFIPMLKEIILQALFVLPKDFDCCHLYEQCSDAKICVHKDFEYALGCGYQRIMRRGKYFWGKNRNV